MGTPICAIGALYSNIVRSILFFFVIYGTTILNSGSLDINFLSREWYRGTTRGIEMSLLDIIIVGLFFSELIRSVRERKFYIPKNFLLYLVFFAYCLFSLLISSPRLFCLFEITKLVRGLLIFLTIALFIRGEKELKILVLALCCAALYQSQLAVKQRYFYGINRVFGNMDSPNGVSTYLLLIVGTVIPVIFTENIKSRLKFLCLITLACAFVTILLTVSRTGFVVIMFVTVGTSLACISMPKLNFATLKVVLGVIIGSVILSAALFKASDTIKGRMLSEDLESEFGEESLSGRGVYTRLALQIIEDHFWGVGLNNWSYYVSNNYGPEIGIPYNPYVGTDKTPDQELSRAMGNLDTTAQAAPAHGLIPLYLGELGIPGLILFGFFWIRFLVAGLRFLIRRKKDLASRLAIGIQAGIAAMLLQGFTEWNYRFSSIFLMVHILLGVWAAIYQNRQKPGHFTDSPGIPLPAAV